MSCFAASRSSSARSLRHSTSMGVSSFGDGVFAANQWATKDRAAKGAGDESLSAAATPRRERAPGSGLPDRRRQVRLDVPLPGPDHARAGSRGHRRPCAGPGARGVPARRLGRGTPLRYALHRRHAVRHRRERRGGRRGGDRPCPGRHRPRAARDRPGQAHRDGERGGRRARRSSAGAPSGARGRGLFPRLWRPAGTDLRAGRLGARLRLPGYCAPARGRSICQNTMPPPRRRSGAITG